MAAANIPITRETLQKILWEGTAWKAPQESLERFLDLVDAYSTQNTPASNVPKLADTPAPEVGADGMCPTCGNNVELSLGELTVRFREALEEQTGALTAERLLEAFALALPDCAQCDAARRELAVAQERENSLRGQIRSMEDDWEAERAHGVLRVDELNQQITALEDRNAADHDGLTTAAEQLRGQIAFLEDQVRQLNLDKESNAEAYLETNDILQGRLASGEMRATELTVQLTAYEQQIAQLNQELEETRAALADALACSIFGAQDTVAPSDPTLTAVPDRRRADSGRSATLDDEDPLLIQKVVDAIAGLPADVTVMAPYGRLADGAQVRLFRFDADQGRVRLVMPPETAEQPGVSAAEAAEHLMADPPSATFGPRASEPNDAHADVRALAASIAGSIAAWPLDDQPPQDAVPDDMRGACAPVDLSAPAVDVKGDKGGHGVRHSTAYDGDEGEPKICKKCGIEKTRGDFYKDRSLKDGRCSKCRACSSAAAVREEQESADADA